MKEYEPVTSLVNGEIIRDLLDLCNEQFLYPMGQKFAGANRECMFCGACELRNGDVPHSANCPSVKYIAIVEDHKRWIVKK